MGSNRADDRPGLRVKRSKDHSFGLKLEKEQRVFINDSQVGSGATSTVNDSSSSGQQDWSAVWECFESPHRLLSLPAGGLSKSMQEMVKNAVSEMRRYYSRKVVDVLIKVTRRTLDLIIKQFTTDANSAEESQKKPLFLLHASLMIPNVSVTPTLDDIQEVLLLAGKHISGLSKGVAQWTGGKTSRVSWKKIARPPSNPLLDVVTKLDEQVQSVTAPPPALKSTKMVDMAKMKRKKHYRLESEEKPQFPFQQKNFYSYVMENKEIIKTLTLLSLCSANVKTEVNTLVKRWRPYHYLWKCEKTLRQLLAWNLNDFEISLKRHSELEAKLESEPDFLIIGNCLAVSTEKLKLGLTTELKNGTHRISQAMRKKYKREMDYVYAIMNDLDRKLERPIRDLDDVRTVMETLKKIREQEVDMELRIDPVEEAFNIITRYDLPVSKEDLEQVDNLRYTWQQLQARALASHFSLLKMQPQLEDDLNSNLDKFREDNSEYVHEYRYAGPMQPGLSPREASDRLILFQNRFDGMWRKLQTYQNGEELFGLPHTEYPELAQIRKELNLLQKLYKLYNDVIDRVSSYYDIPWGEVNIEEINNELMEFQNRCRKLPKGLKEWPAFFALKKTIDDFNDMCPLLELMANKAMKPRHWQRIMEVTKYNFELDNEDFCLKNILEAPLLPNKEDIEVQ
ncbi:unnamed protein product [Spodoptera exigua]|nr:unnamed protein product [Spodoptera exigua]